MPRLSEHPPGHRFEIRCVRCNRAGRLTAARLLARHGDILLTELLERLTADCPRRAHSAAIYDRCEAVFSGR